MSKWDCYVSSQDDCGVLYCRHGERLAVKIVRNIEKYHYAAKVEVDILSDLQKSNSPAKQWATLYSLMLGHSYLLWKYYYYMTDKSNMTGYW